MRRGRGVFGAVVVLGLLAACSGGGSGSAAKTTTTTASTTTTTVAVTTTTTPEDAVKQAYLDYWKMIDRLIAAPDASDPELELRAVDPLLSAVRDDMSTRKSEGRTTRPPANSKYAHVIQKVIVSATTATIVDCYVDDRVQFSADGSVLNDAVSTDNATSTLVLAAGAWRVSSVDIRELGAGDLGCAA